MKIYYITLNTLDEIKAVSYALLNNRYAVCTNWFPISCAYRWEGEIKEESEMVLIVKTTEGMRENIEKTIAEHIMYTNFIAEIDIHSVNGKFKEWLDMELGEVLNKRLSHA